MKFEGFAMFSRFRMPGRVNSDWLLFGLMGLVVVLALTAIGRAVLIQKKAAHTFVGWHEDMLGYQQTVAEQKASGKPMLVYFYATWCPHCKRFTAQILSSDKMQNYVKRYPHVRIAPDNGKAEKQLMESYGAEGFPTFLVVKSNGKRTKMEPYTMDDGRMRMKTPDEFIQDVERAAH
jgi:thiol:disulfide interchange protein